MSPSAPPLFLVSSPPLGPHNSLRNFGFLPLGGLSFFCFRLTSAYSMTVQTPPPPSAPFVYGSPSQDLPCVLSLSRENLSCPRGSNSYFSCGYVTLPSMTRVSARDFFLHSIKIQMLDNLPGPFSPLLLFLKSFMRILLRPPSVVESGPLSKPRPQ